MVTFSNTNSPSIFKPLCTNLFGSCGSVILYLERYTFDIKNPVMKMKDGFKNLKYR